MRLNLPNFRMPRAVDPHRRHDVRAWAGAEQEAARHPQAMGWRERGLYGLIVAAALIIGVAVVVRLL